MLLDLGFAKVTDEHALANPEQLLGTPLYVSPEQTSIRARSMAVPICLGCGIVLFENLTGG